MNITINLHFMIFFNPNSIQINIYPYPNLQPMISQNNEKHVRSEADYTEKDNLLKLPRE